MAGVWECRRIWVVKSPKRSEAESPADEREAHRE